MSDLKSAWEVAQERANRLGKLSTQEKERQERQTHLQAGQALARKWLDGSQRLDIATELGKHEGQGRETMKQAIIEHLVEAIAFKTAEAVVSVKGILEAIISLRPELQPRAEGIGQLVQEYELAEQKIKQELESQYREALHQLRISGTAVDTINLEDNPQWQLARHGLIQSFDPRLNALKQALLGT